MQRKVQVRATCCLFLTAVIWGVAFVAQRAAADSMGAMTFNGVRFGLGALSLVPVILIFERKEINKKTFQKAAIAGLLGGFVLLIAAGLQQLGVELTGSAGKSGFITGLYIVMTPILGLFLKKKAGLFVWCGAVLACGGLYLLSVPAGGFSIGSGDLMLLVGAVFWAVHILLVDHYAGGVPPILFSMLQFLVCSVLSMTGAFLFEEVTPAMIYAGRVPLLYSGLLSVGVAYTLQVIGQRYVEPARAAIIFSTESLFAALGAAVLLSEVMPVRGYAGCALIFTGILVSQITIRKRVAEYKVKG